MLRINYLNLKTKNIEFDLLTLINFIFLHFRTKV